ncbi:MAG: AAA family ATPase [Acholeplasma sp.]|nr:AAA family ATPase [Acholeplasma sp.]
MYRRKITQSLVEWHDKVDKQVLIIKGPKGIGKSTIIEKFAKENYKHLIKLDFEKNPKLKLIFDGDLDLATITKKITIFLQTERFSPNQTLFFFDEVHLCPNARLAMKTLYDSKKYDCIMATSYFAINPEVFPASALQHEHILSMNSLDFEEYLWANGVNEHTIKSMQHHFENNMPLVSSLHDTMIDLFKEYMIVGGMPDVITSFFETHNFKTVSKQQKKIIQMYYKDMQTYLSKPDYVKGIKAIESIPLQLEKENKKFQYGVIEYRSTARKYENIILWLYYTDIINISFNLDEPKWPFASHAKHDVFKVYFKDIGLLSGFYGAQVQQELLLGKTDVKQGALLEAVVADILMKTGEKLYYFSTNTTLEVDFLIKGPNGVIPLEVKSADNTKSKTMKTLFENYDFKEGIKLSMENYSHVNGVHKIPIYMTMFM